MKKYPMQNLTNFHLKNVDENDTFPESLSSLKKCISHMHKEKEEKNKLLFNENVIQFALND
jgi:hypothetical protein